MREKRKILVTLYKENVNMLNVNMQNTYFLLIHYLSSETKKTLD